MCCQLTVVGVQFRCMLRLTHSFATFCDMKPDVSTKDLFLECLESLKPEKLLDGHLRYHPRTQTLQVSHQGGDTSYSLANGFYVVGFGKAVLGLAACLLDMTQGAELRGGVLSLPHGTSDLALNTAWLQTCRGRGLRIFEGARDNLPDQDSEAAARAVVDTVTGLGAAEVVVALVSGGGSALLPLPAPGLALADKLGVVRLLGRAGADIVQLNTVRTQLSAVKGGKLARLAAPARTLGLIVSDIVGDPVQLIASGPTVPGCEGGEAGRAAAWDIITRHGLGDQVADTVRRLLTRPGDTEAEAEEEEADVQNIMIGSNEAPLRHLLALASARGPAALLTRRLTGEAREVGQLLASLVRCICLEAGAGLQQRLHHPSLDPAAADQLGAAVRAYTEQGPGATLVLLAGGETTVRVRGGGRGGRNQELVLSFAAAVAGDTAAELRAAGHAAELLSCGTDGIDGPTPAAGAVWSSELGLDSAAAAASLENNDSYTFWRQQAGCLVVTGHTGTNVADIVICVIRKYRPGGDGTETP